MHPPAKFPGPDRGRSDATRAMKPQSGNDGDGPPALFGWPNECPATSLGSPTGSAERTRRSLMPEMLTDALPPAHAVVLSVDEKSHIQTLDRTQPGLPLKKGRGPTMSCHSLPLFNLPSIIFVRRTGLKVIRP